MRIIGGKYGGRKFYPPADNWPTRPTTDFAKEALFNILTNRFDFEQVRFADLFGGTGSHSFEMISRGCRDVTYVDKFRPCVHYVKDLAEELGIEQFINVVRSDVFRFCERFTGAPFDYIFAGPPYALKNIPDIPSLIFQLELLKDQGLFILEHNHLHDFREHAQFREVRKYGQCHFSMFEKTSELT